MSMDADVIIVGAGPVGLLLAGELRLGGASVLVLEQLAEPGTESRASTLHARTMEILDQRGLLTALGTPPQDGMGHFGGIPLDLGTSPGPYPGQWKVLQARTEALLQDWALGLGAQLRRGHRVIGLNQYHDGVDVEVYGPSGAYRLGASQVVGCDGEDSTVRQLADFAFPGRDATRELLRADVDGIDIPNRRFERLEHGLAIAARRPDGVTRVMVHEFGRPAQRRVGPPEFEEIVAVWRRVTGEDIGRGTPLWLNAFGNTRRQAERYRQGRILLAGDAAHRQLPVGGQALNLGLQDAVNLGWKLAAQVRGDAPAGLLDSYHHERHAVGARVLGNIEAQAQILLGGPEVGPLRAVLAELMAYHDVRDHLAGMISGLEIRYPDPDGGDHPLLGRRLPPGELHTADGPVGTAALLHPGRGLLLDLGAGITAAGWAGRVRTVGAQRPAGEGPSGLLIRPDGHIAWVAGGAVPLDTALRRWFGAPTGRAATG